MKLFFCLMVAGEKFNDDTKEVTLPLSTFSYCTQLTNPQIAKAMMDKNITETVSIVYGERATSVNMAFNGMMHKAIKDLKADYVILLDLSRPLPENMINLLLSMIKEMDPNSDSIGGLPQHNMYFIPATFMLNTGEMDHIDFDKLHSDWNGGKCVEKSENSDTIEVPKGATFH